MPDTIDLVIYSRRGCHLCEEMKELVERVVRDTRIAAQIKVVNIDGDPDLESRYGLEIPVLMVDGKKAAKYRITERALRLVVGR